MVLDYAMSLRLKRKTCGSELAREGAVAVNIIVE